MFVVAPVSRPELHPAVLPQLSIAVPVRHLVRPIRTRTATTAVLNSAVTRLPVVRQAAAVLPVSRRVVAAVLPVVSLVAVAAAAVPAVEDAEDKF